MRDGKNTNKKSVNDYKTRLRSIFDNKKIQVNWSGSKGFCIMPLPLYVAIENLGLHANQRKVLDFVIRNAFFFNFEDYLFINWKTLSEKLQFNDYRNTRKIFVQLKKKNLFTITKGFFGIFNYSVRINFNIFQWDYKYKHKQLKEHLVAYYMNVFGEKILEEDMPESFKEIELDKSHDNDINERLKELDEDTPKFSKEIVLEESFDNEVVEFLWTHS